MCEVRASVYGEDKVDGAERNVWGSKLYEKLLGHSLHGKRDRDKIANKTRWKCASASRFDIRKNSEIDILPLIFKNICNNIEKQI